MTEEHLCLPNHFVALAGLTCISYCARKRTTPHLWKESWGFRLWHAIAVNTPEWGHEGSLSMAAIFLKRDIITISSGHFDGTYYVYFKDGRQYQPPIGNFYRTFKQDLLPEDLRTGGPIVVSYEGNNHYNACFPRGFSLPGLQLLISSNKYKIMTSFLPYHNVFVLAKYVLGLVGSINEVSLSTQKSYTVVQCASYWRGQNCLLTVTACSMKDLVHVHLL